jgi:hypothetical protein
MEAADKAGLDEREKREMIMARGEEKEKDEDVEMDIVGERGKEDADEEGDFMGEMEDF